MKKAKFALAALVALLILFRPESSVAGAQRAMRLWCESVAPSLFPFLALMPMLTGEEACRAYGKLFSGAMQRLFHLPGSAAPALVIGMIAGSPGGAIAVRSVAASAGLSKNQAHRLALAVAGFSPAYLLLGVGCGLFDSSSTGWKLVGIQAAVQLALLVFLQAFRLAGDEPCPQLPPAASGSMGKAVESVMAICGYMVVFGAVGSVVAGLIGKRAGMILQLAAELPGGLAAIAGENSGTNGVLVCAAIGFGGLCVAAQNVDALRELGVRTGEYLAVRALAAALFAGIGGIVLRERAGSAIPGKIMLPAYALSMFFACMAAVPAMVFLTKNIYLNKRKFE